MKNPLSPWERARVREEFIMKETKSTSP